MELEHVADLRIEVGVPIVIGHMHEGLRRVVPILGGLITGPKLNGRILSAGADFQVIREDGYTNLEARYAAELDDGAMLYIVNTGVRFGPPEVMARIMRGEAVDPELVYFRTQPRFEIAAPGYEWLTRPLFIATGARHPMHVEVTVFEIK
ncbi:MAG: DUF3237 domain-containing protein [Acidocella sp.]|nr:DUF3237 domain-containing protein [Acidocella sp.]